MLGVVHFPTKHPSPSRVCWVNLCSRVRACVRACRAVLEAALEQAGWVHCQP